MFLMTPNTTADGHQPYQVYRALLPLPDPRTHPNVIYMGQLRIPVKAVKGHTIGDLAQRLSYNPFGFYLPYKGNLHALGSPLQMHNIFETYMPSVNGRVQFMKRKPLYLKIRAAKVQVQAQPQAQAQGNISNSNVDRDNSSDQPATKRQRIVATPTAAQDAEQAAKRQERQDRKDTNFYLVHEIINNTHHWEPALSPGLYSSCLPKPSAAFKLCLVPAADHRPGKDPQREGTAVIDLYGYTTDTPTSQTLLKPWRGHYISDMPRTLARLMGFMKPLERYYMNNTTSSVDHHHILQAKLMAAMNSTAARYSDLTPDTLQPPGLAVTLRPHQRTSVLFALMREKMWTHGGYRKLFWTPVHMPGSSGKQVKLWYSYMLGRLSPEVPSLPMGGILADEMGLGKTIEVISLCLIDKAGITLKLQRGAQSGMLTVPPVPRPQEQEQVQGPQRSHLKTSATLVICENNLLGQWVQEVTDKTSGSLRVLMYHGRSTAIEAARLAQDYDIVVTTFGTLRSNHKVLKSSPSPSSPPSPSPSSSQAGSTPSTLYDIVWHRIVIDESHELPDIKSATMAAIVDLPSPRRWACTGTPIPTAVADLKSQLMAIGVGPFLADAFMNEGILGHMLQALVIRHTKDAIALPPKTLAIRAVELRAPEAEAYQSVEREARGWWEQAKAQGPAFINKRKGPIASLLTPLRRMCAGGILAQAELEVRQLSMPEVNSDDVNDGEDETFQNLNLLADAVLGDVDVDDDNDDVAENADEGWDDEDAADEEAGVLEALRAGASTTGRAFESKLRVVLEDLQAMHQKDATSKALVFTRFPKALQWLRRRLSAAEGLACRTITPNMAQAARMKAIAEFQKDPGVRVFLLTARVGAVGINLTAADHVFILEPSLNVAMEDQAISRAWRMGQTRPVKVIRMIVKGSVEEKIVKVLERRMELVQRQTSGGSGACDRQVRMEKIDAAAELYTLFEGLDE
jgi:SNF2 family DNA or RNA helicase